MQIRRSAFWDCVIPHRTCAWKKEISIGINMTAMAMKILIEEPEYQVMRDRDANTAVSSLAITLPQAKTGAKKR